MLILCTFTGFWPGSAIDMCQTGLLWVRTVSNVATLVGLINKHKPLKLLAGIVVEASLKQLQLNDSKYPLLLQSQFIFTIRVACPMSVLLPVICERIMPSYNTMMTTVKNNVLLRLAKQHRGKISSSQLALWPTTSRCATYCGNWKA